MAPVTAILLIESAPVPVLLNVTTCAPLVVPTSCEAKLKLAGDKLAAGATPVPVRLTDCGLPVALSVIASDSFSAPVVVGVKVMLNVQLPPAATELPHVFV